MDNNKKRPVSRALTRETGPLYAEDLFWGCVITIHTGNATGQAIKIVRLVHSN